MPKAALLRPVLVIVIGIATVASAASPLADAVFIDETHHAMDRMMTGMAVTPSGNTDRDFAEMMIPHHQGAIDMAVAELRFGRDERLRRIAQEIIVDQQQEIVAMRAALDAQHAPPSRPTAMMMPNERIMP